VKWVNDWVTWVRGEGVGWGMGTDLRARARAWCARFACAHRLQAVELDSSWFTSWHGQVSQIG
jgi:hypothetical protein